MFLGKEDNDNFLETLAEPHALWGGGVEVFAYCLMGNRYHLCRGFPTRIFLES